MSTEIERTVQTSTEGRSVSEYVIQVLTKNGCSKTVMTIRCSDTDEDHAVQVFNTYAKGLRLGETAWLERRVTKTNIVHDTIYKAVG